MYSVQDIWHTTQLQIFAKQINENNQIGGKGNFKQMVSKNKGEIRTQKKNHRKQFILIM